MGEEYGEDRAIPVFREPLRPRADRGRAQRPEGGVSNFFGDESPRTRRRIRPSSAPNCGELRALKTATGCSGNCTGTNRSTQGVPALALLSKDRQELDIAASAHRAGGAGAVDEAVGAFHFGAEAARVMPVPGGRLERNCIRRITAWGGEREFPARLESDGGLARIGTESLQAIRARNSVERARMQARVR